MDLLIVLLMVIIFLCCLIMICTKDLFCPSAIICESYIVAIISAIYNYNRWNMNFHINTFFIILIGLIIFVGTSEICRTKIAKKLYKENKNKNSLNFINIKSFNVIILDIITLLIACIYLKYFFDAINSFSATTFSTKMEMYRNKTTYEGLVYIPTLINFLSKMCRALAIVYIYILINNFLYNKFNTLKEKDSNFLLYIIGIFIYIPISISSGARFDIIIFLITGIFIWYILYIKYIKKKIEIKKIIKIGVFFIVIAVVFSQSKTLFGRNNNSNGIIDYFTQYFGGAIHCFDVYMQEKHEDTNVIGQELFAGTRKFLEQIHVIKDRNVSDDIGKFIYNNDGEAIGNVYSAFRNMYHDFGVIGILIFQIILAIIFNEAYLYILLKEKKNENIDFSILIYSTIIFCLFFHSYSEYFFSTILSFNYIMLFVWIKIILIWLNKVKL